MTEAFKPFSVKIDTEQEMNVLTQLLDWATRHGGVQAATPVAVFLQKIEAGRMAAKVAEDDASPELDLTPSKANGHQPVAMN